MEKLLFEEQREDRPVTQLLFPVMKRDERSMALPGMVVTRKGNGNQMDTAANVAMLESLKKLASEEQLERAREEGREAAFAECMKRLRDGIAVERTAVTHLCTSFTKERERYFAEVEREVVKLALAIAGRILQRESAMDPTLLEGVVRVALENLGDRSGAVLRMNPEDAEVWAQAMKHSGVVVQGDAGLEPGELRLEAAGGVAELGLKEQLVEIERGFFDLLARRPA